MKVFVGIDLQNDFIAGGALGVEGSEEAIKNIIYLLQGVEYDQYIFTLDYHLNKDAYMLSPEGLSLPIFHCELGTKGMALNKQIIEAIEGIQKTKEVNFVFKSAFYTRELPLTIARKLELTEHYYGESELEIDIVGLCTDICVISNTLALRGHFPEASIVVLAKGCAGTTPEQHEAALKIMKSNAIYIA